jgi:hypothetical protein
MNNEQQELADRAYENYSNKLLFNEKDCHVDYLINQPNKTFIPYSQERFINKCKTDSEFSQKWGLKIEERELSLEERYKIMQSNISTATLGIPRMYNNEYYNSKNIPTKLITITYNNEKIESYE